MSTAVAAIAYARDGLNADRVPTAHGGRSWYHSTVRAVLASLSADVPS